MLQVFSARSIRLGDDKASGELRLLEIPKYAHQELGLRGLLMPTEFFAGASADTFDRFRERADKSSCPCLFLLESEPHSVTEGSAHAVREHVDRFERVLLAGSRLGCSAVGITIAAADTDEAMELAAERLRPVSTRAERLDVTLLIRPSAGLTETPERLTDLIKRVGGFRIGSLPDFESAAASGDASTYLRRLAPYAPVVIASALESGKSRKGPLAECAEALKSVGYDGALAIEHRGNGNLKEAILRTRDAMGAALEED